MKKEVKTTHADSTTDLEDTIYTVSLDDVKDKFGSAVVADLEIGEAEFGADYYLARVISEVIEPTEFAEALLLDADLYMFNGRAGILELAIEKFLYKAEQAESNGDDFKAKVGTYQSHGEDYIQVTEDDDQQLIITMHRVLF